ncbi:hypothetical protein IWQ62_004880 [Dispira parvispora]|uniref:Uncharacterized protein n=1 Tax=Dispira parvispora TaxID=1520584 RepID=A0A9W8AL23_9FUNG|nr:hypothetical protein IWQ62_004880 [Dispira parvispora]
MSQAVVPRNPVQPGSGHSAAEGGTLIPRSKRTSSLAVPSVQLVGHEGEVFTCQFDPTGEVFASGGFDRSILLWRTYGDWANYGMLKGHSGAVLQVQWVADGVHLYSTSTDKTVALWDAQSGERIKRWREHSAIVNCCALQPGFVGPGVVASGSDDGTVRLWDTRHKSSIHTIDRGFPITAVAYNLSGDHLFIAGLDNTITVWDVRQRSISDRWVGHTDTVTGLAVSTHQGALLSYGMDNTARVWDTQPFVAGDRCKRVLQGAPSGFEKNLIKPAWSRDGQLVATGGGDRTITVWHARSGELAYKLPGHKGCVNQVHFHPREPILLSASTDRTLFLGEIDPEP